MSFVSRLGTAQSKHCRKRKGPVIKRHRPRFAAFVSLSNSKRDKPSLACTLSSPSHPPSLPSRPLSFSLSTHRSEHSHYAVMEYRSDQRPPRAARPATQSQSRSQGPPRNPTFSPSEGPRGNVSFQVQERGDRPGQPRQRTMPSAYQSHLSPNADAESAAEYFDPERVARKRSLVRPEREKIEPGHRQWHYRTRVTQMEDRSQGIGVMPSSMCRNILPDFFDFTFCLATGNYPREHLRRGRSLLGREEDQHESGLALFKRNATLRRKRPSGLTPIPNNVLKKKGCWRGPGPGGPWMTYCFIITFLVPPALMRACGMFLLNLNITKQIMTVVSEHLGLRSPEQQRAWREKMGLISLILVLMAGVGFLTFGFTESVCGTPPNRFHGGAIGDGFIGNSSLVINGYDYDFSKFKHPAVGSTFDGESNPVLDGSWNAAGNDASFLFQKVNEKCLGIVTKSSSSSITGSGNSLDWYFPCNIYSQLGNQGANITGYETSFSCHITSSAKTLFNSMRPMGQVYYTWDDVHNSNRNLAVYESYVVFLNFLC